MTDTGAGVPLAVGEDTINVLIVDDNPLDAELLRRGLRRAGVAVECMVAADEAELRSALGRFVPDVVLCDFSFPGFDGLAAQRIVREARANVPLIFVSGSISEERATQALQGGAVDYVMKTSLTRLPSAVQRAVRSARALADAEERTRRLNELEELLRDEEERSRQHAQRLEALLQVVNDPALGDAEKWLAMLAQAVASIWPGQGYRGMLWRIDGSDMILEAIANSPGHRLTGNAPRNGEAVPLSTTVVAKVLADGGGTRSWDNVQESSYVTEFAREQGTRSLVVTTFTAGSATWALTFSSGQTTSKSLGQQEHAYIEVIASFFSKHVQQRWQFQRMEYQQSHDVLTGLLNRSQFRSQARAAAGTSPGYAIAVVDVNAFHEINESYGHVVADALLVEIGNTLQKCASAGELVGRVGGDVFAIYIPMRASSEVLAGRVRDFAGVFAQPFPTGNRRGTKFIARSASIGVAVAPEHGRIIDAIHARADAALTAAKERGHGTIVFYEAGMERDAQARAALRNELVEACARDQFTLHYQPHIDLRTGEVTGCEALIRWNHPERGMIMPDDFIPFAEQAGIITSIDAWVMRRAFAVAGELSALRPGFRLYFNLSGRQAGNPKLVRSFVDAARSGVSLANVGIEVTETDAMRDVEATRRVFRALRRLDVRIAIDDFGTGYSSLASLKRLPVDIVKIDRSFISGITSNAHDATIADTIISFTQHFGFDSLGEGAEQPEDVEWLRRHGCRYVQGYAICRPMPLEALKPWLDARDANVQPQAEMLRPAAQRRGRHRRTKRTPRRVPRVS